MGNSSYTSYKINAKTAELFVDELVVTLGVSNNAKSGFYVKSNAVGGEDKEIKECLSLMGLAYSHYWDGTDEYESGQEFIGSDGRQVSPINAVKESARYISPEQIMANVIANSIKPGAEMSHPLAVELMGLLAAKSHASASVDFDGRSDSLDSVLISTFNLSVSDIVAGEVPPMSLYVYVQDESPDEPIYTMTNINGVEWTFNNDEDFLVKANNFYEEIEGQPFQKVMTIQDAVDYINKFGRDTTLEVTEQVLSFISDADELEQESPQPR